MSALLAANSNASGEARSRSRGYATYLVKPVGPVATVGSEEHPEELVMRAALTRQDGTARNHMLRVRPTERQPDLVDRVRTLLSKNVPVRMIVRFENVVRTDSTKPSVGMQAIADTLLEPIRTNAGVQLDLFG